jgi:ankyrin repeat protein
MNLLSVAMEMEAVAIAEFLIKQGIDVNVVDEEGNTPCNLAAKDESCHKLIEPLVKAGADINHEGSGGYVPIFHVLDPDTISVAKK